jgi:hypothetical protein
MEIVLKTKKKKQHIKRDETRGGDGIIRIDGEACDVLEGILNQLESPMSVRELASVLIKEAANYAIIKEEEE